MNKRIVSALVLAGMIASSSAFASKARELVLGQGGAEIGGTYGSYYYDSVYNMFYNPAYINDYKNWVAFEKGTVGNAEFGFASSMMNFNLGLYFNRKGATQNIATTNQDASVVDLIIGGDSGVKWGLGLNYGQGNNTSNTVQSSFIANAGVSVAGFDPFVGFTIASTDKALGTKTNTYSGMNAGVRYHYGEWVPYAAFGTTKNKDETVTAGTNDVKNTRFAVGLGRETKLAEGARLVYSLYYKHGETKTGDVKTGSFMAIPMQAGVEADALSWLTLRAGVNHTLVGNGAQKKTSAKIGGTFHVSKVDLDYAFGNGNAAGGDSSDSADVGFDANTFHQISMRYSW
jgi:hypothetical protein